jgi:hypothetical protein
MNQTSNRPQRTDDSRSRPTSTNVINIDPTSIVENAKRSALPKELTFGVYFSYQR